MITKRDYDGAVIVKVGTFEATLQNKNRFTFQCSKVECLEVTEAGRRFSGGFVFDLSAATMLEGALKAPVNFSKFLAEIESQISKGETSGTHD